MLHHRKPITSWKYNILRKHVCSYIFTEQAINKERVLCAYVYEVCMISELHLYVLSKAQNRIWRYTQKAT